LTRLLLERGADPNDGEVVYHVPETYDNEPMRVLVESGRLTAESTAMLLARKHDWHDRDGIVWLLDRGADPNHRSRYGTPFHHAVLRANDLDIVQVALDNGADPTIPGGLMSAVSRAARRGRSDLLALFEQRGVPLVFTGVERLIAACCRNDEAAVRSIVSGEPELVSSSSPTAVRCSPSSPALKMPRGSCGCWMWESGSMRGSQVTATGDWPATARRCIPPPGARSTPP
jgi:hypothetical protein